MTKTIITNAFSINMLDESAKIRFKRITTEEASCLATEGTSAVGHAGTARIFAEVLGTQVPCNRATVALTADTRLLVGQYKGPRLPEGATALPSGATIEWWVVEHIE